MLLLLPFLFWQFQWNKEIFANGTRRSKTLKAKAVSCRQKLQWFVSRNQLRDFAEQSINRDHVCSWGLRPLIFFLWITSRCLKLQYVYRMRHTYMHTDIHTLRYIPLHYLAVQYNILHCIALRCITYRCLTLHNIAHHYIPLHTATYHYIGLQNIKQRYIPLNTAKYHHVILQNLIYHIVTLHIIT